MPAFVPTQGQRYLVERCTGMRMPWDEIRLLVINERTKKPISKETLQKAFRDELAVGKSKLKDAIYSAYAKQLESGNWWPVKFGLQAFCDIHDEPRHSAAMSVNIGDDVAPIRIAFVLPGKQAGEELEAPPMRDVSPAKVEVQPRRDYPTEPPTLDSRPLPNTSVPVVDAFKRRGKGFNWP
jgi:hypothetical protein